MYHGMLSFMFVLIALIIVIVICGDENNISKIDQINAERKYGTRAEFAQYVHNK